MKLRAAALGALLMLAACGGEPSPVAILPPPPARADMTPPPSPDFPPLSAGALETHVKMLASDAFAGRKPASPEERMTLDYITGQFQAAGLRPGYRGGWLQPVAMVESTVTNAPTLAINRPGAPQVGLLYSLDQVVWTKRQAVSQPISLTDAPIVFVGYGVVAPEVGWNDYAGLDMKGKIALILINDPDFEADHAGAFGGKAMTYYGRWTYKFEEAARQGAAGALIIHETAPAAYGWSVVQSSWTRGQLDLARPDQGADRAAVEGWVSQDGAARLLAGEGQTYAQLKTLAQRRGFKPIPLKATASITIDITQRTSTSYNVIGVLPGRQRPDESVLYSAHWDHLGRCPAVNGDGICNGARDNALGVAAIIEVARRFVQDGRAERSVAFIAFTGEEQGLLGSYYLAANPVFSPARTAALINIDAPPTNGPTRDMIVVGFGKSDLDQRLQEALAAQGRTITPEAFPERGSFYRSDHFPLAQKGVPTLYASGGLDLTVGGVERGKALSDAYIVSRYHAPSDEFDASWDLTGTSQDLAALYTVGRRIADSRVWPQWSAKSEFRAAREASRAGME